MIHHIGKGAVMSKHYQRTMFCTSFSVAFLRKYDIRLRFVVLEIYHYCSGRSNCSSGIVIRSSGTTDYYK